MSKRIIILFFVLTASLCGLSLRIISVNAGDFARTASYSNSKTVLISKARGEIYDCNLNPIVNTQNEYAVAVKPTVAGLNSASAFVGAQRLAMLREDFSKGNPGLVRLSQKVEGGKDIKVIPYKRRYADNQLATHLLGYVDADGNGVTGIEKSYNEYLCETSGTLKAAFYVDAMGRNLSGAEIEVLDDMYSSKRGVVLTIDLAVQEALENALDDCFIDRGCAVAMDVQTGEIKAMVSRPEYDQMHVADSLKEEGSPLVNKALSAYSVGSTFKVIVAATALEKSTFAGTEKFVCSGGLTVNGTDFGCFNNVAHGEETMQGALVHSCNTYFIDMTSKIGVTDILKTAADVGFGSSNALCPDVVSKAGNLPSSSEFVSQADVANLGFGQGKLLATPLQLACAFASIANGGYSVEPYLLKGYVDDDGHFKEERVARKHNRILKASTCTQLSDMLESVVDENGKARPENTTAAGKTATAQTGQFVDGVEICHSWFAGWYPASNPKYVFVIMKEDGTSGNADCAPAFKKAVDSLTTDSN